ncbi:MAG: hypothetical protein H6834_11130 [Planctomycetes bacterium]|nr:hypothetical protein [Planctomycetota bacterium]
MYKRSPLALFALAFTAAAQDPRLAVDINQVASPFSSYPDASTPDAFVLAGSRAFFRATHPTTGREVWTTDGTAAGTLLLGDILPGQASSTPPGFALTSRGEIGAASIGGSMLTFFAAKSLDEGGEPWVSDGTPAGTRLLRDIHPGPESSYAQEFTAWNGKIYFAARDPSAGLELWESDGTAAGTQLVVDVVPGPTWSNPRHLHVAASGNVLLFQSRNVSNTYDLYATGGTAATTIQLAAIGSNAAIFGPRDFVDVGNLTLFVAQSTAAGDELWVTDGTPAGTHVIDIEPGSASSSPNLADAVVIGTSVYFPATTTANGTELWASDGTIAGTRLVADVVPGAASSTPSSLADAFGIPVFSADTPATGPEPWYLIGTTPILLADLEPGSAGSHPSQFQVIGSELLMAATIGGNEGLYRVASNGQVTQVATVGGVRGLTPFGGGRFLFSGDGGQGHELWITNGSVAGTGMVVEIGTGQRTIDAEPLGLRVTTDGAIFFQANDGLTGREPWLWRPGGAPRLLADLEPGTSGSFAGLLAQAETWSLVIARTSALGSEPYAWNHANATVTLLRDIHPTGSSSPTSAAAIGNRIVFSAEDPVNGTELWVSDGSPAGTILLRDIDQGSGHSRPSGFTLYRDRVLFTARTATSGTELWVTNGTAAGTTLLLDIEPGPNSSSPSFHGEFDGDLWFTATTTQHGREFWRTDGTVAGTRLALDIVPGATGSFPESSVRVGHELVFTAGMVGLGTELFATDGTPGGTRLIKDIQPGPLSGCRGSRLVRAGEQVFLKANDGSTGFELWVSDLTSTGTRLVRDLRPGSGGNISTTVIAVGERVYFGASTSEFPNGFWVSDGTPAGTSSVGGLSTNSSTVEGVTLDGVLYAALVDVVAGDELFAILDPGALVEDLGDRCPSNWSALDASPPTLGGTMTLQGLGAPGGHIGFTAVATAAPRVLLPGIVAPGCWSRALPYDVVLPTTTSRDWQLQVPIPSTPSLRGASVVLQTYYLQQLGTLPIETSNAIRVTLGR